jgi:hypothetical protein
MPAIVKRHNCGFFLWEFLSRGILARGGADKLRQSNFDNTLAAALQGCEQKQILRQYKLMAVRPAADLFCSTITR